MRACRSAVPIALLTLFAACVGAFGEGEGEEDIALAKLPLGSCSVAPNPVDVDVEYVVTGRGLPANRDFGVLISDGSGTRELTRTTDASGSLSVATTSSAGGEGTVRLLLRTRVLASCTFDVVASCTPTTCADEGASCGTIDDGCGGTLACGTCTLPSTCGGGGVPNECGQAATTLNVFHFKKDMTAEQFRNACSNMTYDVIEMEHGVYAHWHVVLNVDRSARPLTIRPAQGATVTFDDTAPTSIAGAFQFGNGGKAAHLTFDGTGGRFVIQNYSIRQTGLIWTGYAEHITLKGFTTRNNSARDGAASNGQTEHTVYASAWNGNRGDYLTFDDWDVTTGALGKLNALHIYHTPAASHVTARNWIVRGAPDARCYWAVISIPTTDLLLRDWSIDYTIVPVHIGAGSTGRIENVKSLHGQNVPVIPSGIVQVNNSWSPG